jgi:hypothetical protein
VEVRASAQGTEDVCAVRTAVEVQALAGCEAILQEQHGSFMKWHVEGRLVLATVFGALEELKGPGPRGIAHYSVSQCTLENVFIRFAKEQREETQGIDGIL